MGGGLNMRLFEVSPVHGLGSEAGRFVLFKPWLLMNARGLMHPGLEDILWQTRNSRWPCPFLHFQFFFAMVSNHIFH